MITKHTMALEFKKIGTSPAVRCPFCGRMWKMWVLRKVFPGLEPCECICGAIWYRGLPNVKEVVE